MTNDHVCALPPAEHTPPSLAFDDRGDDYDRHGWHRVEGDRTDSAHREVFSWRYNPVVNQLTRRYYRAQCWAKIVYAAVLERPIVSGVSISGAQLSAVDGPVLVGRDTSIDQCTVTTQLRVVASSVRVTGCHFKGPDVDLSRVHVERARKD